MDTNRLSKQIAFIVEIDQLKSVIRRSILVDGSRRENSAEHSWHLAMMACLLAEYAAEEVDLIHAIKLVLLHDIVEIDAGDTYAYDSQGYEDKAEREQRAADRLFGILPDDQQRELRELWEEFEAVQTPEARFANALDRLQPMLLAHHGDGGSWRGNNLRRSQVIARMVPIGSGIPIFGPEVERIIAAAVIAGIILEDESEESNDG